MMVTERDGEYIIALMNFNNYKKLLTEYENLGKEVTVELDPKR